MRMHAHLFVSHGLWEAFLPDNCRGDVLPAKTAQVCLAENDRDWRKCQRGEQGVRGPGPHSGEGPAGLPAASCRSEYIKLGAGTAHHRTRTPWLLITTEVRALQECNKQVAAQE